MLHLEFPVGEKKKRNSSRTSLSDKVLLRLLFSLKLKCDLHQWDFGVYFLLFASKTWFQINVSCSSVDIPRLLTGNESIPYRPLNPGSCVECRKSTGNQDCCKSLVSQLVCQAKCHQCQQLPRSLQQLHCQHKRCKNQSFSLSFPPSPDDKVAILKTHPFGSFICLLF